ncbi:hypothetical protein [Clostridium sp. C2-6-12]|uniref:hypothetical protein n=1 Tax=Clostridium sp. C2-6-12 TaxID=2698832 RepID=UPI001371CE9C|nr:hypothetical protein [Clostridium sp. C2-6-12]
MNKIYKNILILIMVVIASVQGWFISNINKQKNIVVCNNINSEIINNKSLKDINEELSCLNDKNILSANEVNGKWYVKVKIKGDKDKLVQEISKLKNYEINDYFINRVKGENFIVLDICSKENI